MGHQQAFCGQRRGGYGHFAHFFALLAGGTQQAAHADGDFLRLCADAFALCGEQVAAADTVEQAQAERFFQSGDAARYGAVLHAEGVGCGGKGLFFYEYGEAVQVVPVVHGLAFVRAGWRKTWRRPRHPNGLRGRAAHPTGGSVGRTFMPDVFKSARVCRASMPETCGLG